MKLTLVVTSSLLLLASFSEELQMRDTLDGREFLFSYPGILKLTVKLYVSGQTGTNVIVIHHGNVSESQTIGNTNRVAFIIPCSTAVRIHADKNVFAVACSSRGHRDAEAMFILPIAYLSNKYYIIAREGRKGPKFKSVMSVTTYKHVTQFNITLKMPQSCSNSNKHVTQLNSFETYELYCEGDITGTLVESSAPVAIVSGHKHVHIPLNETSYDMVFSMMMPVRMYGTEYVVHDVGPAPALYRVLSAADNTTVQWSTKKALLNQGDFMEIDTSGIGATCLRSDMPVLVVVFYKSFSSMPWNKTGNGDPFMAVVPSTSHYSSSYLIPDIPRPSRRHRQHKRYVSMVFIGDQNWNGLSEVSSVVTKQHASCSRISVVTVQIHALPKGRQVLQLNHTSNFGFLYFALGNRYGLAYSGYSMRPGETALNISLGLELGTVSLTVTTDATASFPPETLQTITRESETERTTNYIVLPTSGQDKAIPSVSPTLEASSDAQRRSQTGTTRTQMSSTATMRIGTPMIKTTSIITQVTGTSSSLVSFFHQVSSAATTQLETIMPTSASSSLASLFPAWASSISTHTSATLSLSAKKSNKTITSELLNQTGQPTRTVSGKCICTCKNKDRMNSLQENVQIRMKESIRSKLAVNTKTLSKTVIKKTSSTDPRPSAKRIGYFGIVLMIIPVLIVLGTDIFNFMFPLISAKKKPKR